MRDTEFRGRRLDGKGWAYGFLFVEKGRAYIITDSTGFGFIKFEVDPATVGQYTGLKDKNDKKIYEGDILQDEIGFKGKIIYSMGAFCGDFGEGFELQYFSEGLHEACILAGNIHDNPELLNNFADSK